MWEGFFVRHIATHTRSNTHRHTSNFSIVYLRLQTVQWENPNWNRRW